MPHMRRFWLCLIALLVALGRTLGAETYKYRDPQTSRWVIGNQPPSARPAPGPMPQQQPPLPTSTFTGQAVSIQDGDTLDVLHARRPVTIRLHGIDTPENGRAFGTVARQFTADLVHRQTVTVVVRGTDRYGRVVGEVRLADGRSLNTALVRAWLAWWYRQYAPTDTTLAQLEAEARAAKRGLWSDPQAGAPWEYRAVGQQEASQTSRTTRTGPGERTIHTAHGAGNSMTASKATKFISHASSLTPPGCGAGRDEWQGLYDEV